MTSTSGQKVRKCLRYSHASTTTMSLLPAWKLLPKSVTILPTITVGRNRRQLKFCRAWRLSSFYRVCRKPPLPFCLQPLFPMLQNKNVPESRVLYRERAPDSLPAPHRYRPANPHPEEPVPFFARDIPESPFLRACLLWATTLCQSPRHARLVRHKTGRVPTYQHRQSRPCIFFYCSLATSALNCSPRSYSFLNIPKEAKAGLKSKISPG